jgi:hypothetical protein
MRTCTKCKTRWEHVDEDKPPPADVRPRASVLMLFDAKKDGPLRAKSALVETYDPARSATMSCNIALTGRSSQQ